MKKDTLLNKVKSLGYPLLETEETFDANDTLAEVVKSKNLRLWEGFPVLLANSVKKGLFDSNKVEACFKTTKDKKYFRNLVLMSLALFEYLQLEFTWAENLKHSTWFNKKLFNGFFKQFNDGKKLLPDLKGLASLRVLSAFQRYFAEEKTDFKEYVQLNDTFQLEYSLSQVFSKKQKELFMKKLKGEKMTKTEREYYSRSVKKKVLALANVNLHKLALKIAVMK